MTPNPAIEPVIRYSAFTELGVQFWVILKHAFFKRLHERFRGEGVKFAVPARTVTISRRS